MTMSVTRIFTFEAAHWLPNYDGPCAVMHGHSYILHVTYTGPVQRNGMVIDFGDVKAAVEPILNTLDHHCLNDTIPTPTAETILKYIKARLNDGRVSKLVLYETAKCYATWEA